MAVSVGISCCGVGGRSRGRCGPAHCAGPFRRTSRTGLASLGRAVGRFLVGGRGLRRDGCRDGVTQRPPANRRTHGLARWGTCGTRTWERAGRLRSRAGRWLRAVLRSARRETLLRGNPCATGSFGRGGGSGAVDRSSRRRCAMRLPVAVVCAERAPRCGWRRERGSGSPSFNYTIVCL